MGSFSDPFLCTEGPFLLPRSGEALTKGVKKVPRCIKEGSKKGTPFLPEGQKSLYYIVVLETRFSKRFLLKVLSNAFCNSFQINLAPQECRLQHELSSQTHQKVILMWPAFASSPDKRREAQSILVERQKVGSRKSRQSAVWFWLVAAVA